jgi:hypothetical protein
MYEQSVYEKDIDNFSYTPFQNSFFQLPLLLQNPAQDTCPGAIHGLTLHQWDKVNSRWTRLQPRIDVITIRGDTINAQLISIPSESITLFRGSQLPFDEVIAGRTEELAITDIESIFLKKGGSQNYRNNYRSDY